MNADADPLSGMSPLQMALLARRVRESSEDLEIARREPIAIVGAGCRLPGGVDDLESFWELLRSGQEAIGEVPADRWDIEAYYDANPEAPGKMNCRYGAFLEHVDRFAAEFFGIAPREAASMDPQQRLLLEVAWEALENAGEMSPRLKGSRTGVFLGLSTNDYAQLELRCGDATRINPYSLSGASPNMLAGRLSYLLGLEGPSLVVDTACSSSLVAMHLACQSLRLGECRLAITGGVNLILTPELSIYMSKVGVLAPDGRAKVFDVAADGYVRGEGCGVLVLKRLSDAVADGNHMLALIRGSAVNQDGRSAGLVVPNGAAETAVVRGALANAGVGAEKIDYVEAHATGISLADLVELRSLADSLAPGDSARKPLTIGSLKANLGHLEAASGVAGVLKIVAALKHEAIPPLIHLSQTHHDVERNGWPFVFPTTTTPWPRSARPRLAGVSAFGFSGTNAHAILEEAPRMAAEQTEVDRPRHVLTLRAKSGAALRHLARRYADRLAYLPDGRLADACFTANTGRMPLRHRLAITAACTAEAQVALSRYAEGDVGPELVSGAAPRRAPALTLLLSGWLSGWINAGRFFDAAYPTFHQATDACAETARRYDLPSVAYRGRHEWGLFVFQFALLRLLRQWGVCPVAVAGEGVGKLVAACEAGVLQLDDAARLVVERQRIIAWLDREVLVARVAASADRVEDEIRRQGAPVYMASVRDAGEVVLAGTRAGAEALLARFVDQGISCSPAPTSFALQTPLADKRTAALDEVLESIRFGPAEMDMLDPARGETLAADTVRLASQWRKMLSSATHLPRVRHTACRDARGMLFDFGHGPGPDDSSNRAPSGNEAHGSNQIFAFGHGGDMVHSLIKSLGRLFVAGISVDWSAFDRPFPRQRIELPTYPFERRRHWVEPPAPPHGARSPNEAALSSAADSRESGPTHGNGRIVWRQKPHSAAVSWAPVRSPRRWLLLAGDHALIARVVEYLKIRGDLPIVLDTFGSPHKSDGDAMRFSIGQGDLPETLHREIFLGDAPRLIGVVDFRHIGCEGRGRNETAREDRPHGESKLGDVLEPLVAEMSRRGLAVPRRWIVTRGAVQAFDGQSSNLGEDHPWRPRSAPGSDHPWTSVACIDLDPRESADDLDALLDELLAKQHDRYVAVRDCARLVGHSGDWNASKQAMSDVVDGYDVRPQQAERDEPSLTEAVSRCASLVLGRDPGEPIAADVPLRDLGLDSLMAIRLTQDLSRIVGTKLPADFLGGQDTTGTLVARLRQRLGGSPPGESPPRMNRDHRRSS